MKLRSILLVASTGLIMVAGQSASAHVTFSFPSETTVRHAVSAPVEAATHGGTVDLTRRYNQKITLTFPDGFGLKSCKSNADFKCKVKRSNGTITWTRRGSSVNFLARDVLEFKVKTPAVEDLYEIPARQLYGGVDGGDTVVWDKATCAFGEVPPACDGTSAELERPAPQMRVRIRT